MYKYLHLRLKFLETANVARNYINDNTALLFSISTPSTTKKMYLYGKIVNLTFVNAKVPYFETFRSKASPPSEREDSGGR